MKKVILSLLLLGTVALPASAASKMKRKAHHPAVAGAGIDHSRDAAYSSNWADKAQSPAPDVDFTVGAGKTVVPYMMGKTYYYGLNNFTLYGKYANTMNAAYQGMDAPTYDGAAKNAYRNMRANNESEPLPSNHGK